jgi:nucleotide-binding universal stress UspA family protein
MNIETAANPIQTATEDIDGQLEQRHAGERKKSVKPPQIQNILVAVDFSDFSKAAVRYAVFLGETFGAKLTLAHSVESCIYPEDLSAGFTSEEVDARWIKEHQEKMETLRKTIQPEIVSTVVVSKGTAWNEIVTIAKSSKADLIVVGTHGRTGLKHALMGSTAERIVRHAACPVLVVHLPDK